MDKKMLQSQYGAVGECSDNFMFETMFDSLVENNYKQPVKDTPTELDCLLMLSSICVGNKYKEEDLKVLSFKYELKGTKFGLAQMLEGLLDARPELIHSFLFAIKKHELRQRGLIGKKFTPEDEL